MQSKQNPLNLVCHPYMFALKEGREIKKNMMDFSLLLLHRTCTEYIKSPSKAKNFKKNKKVI